MAGFTPGHEVAIALDIAASELGQRGRYRLGLEKRELDSDGLSEMLLGPMGSAVTLHLSGERGEYEVNLERGVSGIDQI